MKEHHFNSSKHSLYNHSYYCSHCIPNHSYYSPANNHSATVAALAIVWIHRHCSCALPIVFPAIQLFLQFIFEVHLDRWALHRSQILAYHSMAFSNILQNHYLTARFTSQANCFSYSSWYCLDQFIQRSWNLHSFFKKMQNLSR